MTQLYTKSVRFRFIDPQLDNPQTATLVENNLNNMGIKVSLVSDLSTNTPIKDEEGFYVLSVDEEDVDCIKLSVCDSFPQLECF